MVTWRGFFLAQEIGGFKNCLCLSPKLGHPHPRFPDYLKHREIKDQPRITQQSHPGVFFSRVDRDLRVLSPLLFAPVYTRRMERRQSIKSRQRRTVF